MSDFLNKTWTIESEECLDEEILDECYASIQMNNNTTTTVNANLDSTHTKQVLNTTTSLSTTFSVDSHENEIKNTTMTLANETFSSSSSSRDSSNNFNKCSNDILNLFNKLELSSYFSLLDEDLTGFEIENGDPICTRAIKPRVTKSRASNLINQTIDIEETKPKENLNVTVNIQDQLNVTVNKSPKASSRPSETGKLNVTIDIEDDIEPVKEPLNVTIEIKDTKGVNSNDVLFNDIESGNINQPILNTFVHQAIPNSFDVFADDLNKQSLVNSPTSSSSASATSSTSSLNLNRLYNPNSNATRGVLPTSSKLANYKTSVKILTSSVDKDLNKIAQTNENKNEKSKPRPSLGANLPRSSIPGFKSSVSTQILRNSTNNNTPTTNNVVPLVNKNTATITRKKSLKKPGVPSSPSSNINNRTIDIGDENKLVKTSDVLFNDIESGNINQPILNTFVHQAIPNSFDVFADDLNKQSLVNSPTSSSSASATSSTSSLNSNRLYNPNSNVTRGVLPTSSKLANYKTSVKILTSSVDKDLNKIAQTSQQTKQEETSRPKPPTAPPARSMIPSLKTGIPVPSFKSAIPMYKPSSGQVLRNSTNNNIAVKK